MFTNTSNILRSKPRGGTSDHPQGKSSNVEENSIRIIPLNGERYKFRMWSGRFLARAGRLGYDNILIGTVKTPSDNAEENTKEDDILKQLNKNAYKDLVLAQDETVCFHTVE